MRPVSDRFLRTLRGSHKLASRARVCTTWQTGTNPTGTEIPVLDGDVILDATGNVRGTLSMTTVGEGMWPRSASDLLAPYGNEVFVERGLEYGDGETEWISQGYYRIETPEQDIAPDGLIRLAASDRMQGVRDADLLHPVQFASGTTLGEIVSTLINGEFYVYPSATIEWDNGDTQAVDRAGLVVEDNRYAFLDDLIRAHGKIWYWDHRGVLVIKDPPDPGVPVWEVNAGTDGVLTEMSRSLTRTEIFNGVVAYGEAGDAQAPVLSYAVDMDPNSPTYWYGPFGFHTRRYSSPFITTTTQAFTAAAAILRQSLGAPYNVDFGAVVNPALEPFDPVTVAPLSHVVSQTNRVERHVLDRVTIPLTASQAMTAVTREQLAGTIGAPSI